jgi:hypothetical protein
MSRPGIKPRTPLWEATTLEKRQSNSLLICSFSEHLQMSQRPVENAHDKIKFKSLEPQKDKSLFFSTGVTEQCQ